MRSRVPLFVLLLLVGSFVLPAAVHAGGIPFFGPIIDPSWTVSSTGIQCALGWGAVITVINNIISFLLTLAIVFVAPIMIAYAGFLFVVNPVNASGKEHAKKILLNTVVGIVVALAAWMIVDALMAVLYNPATAGSTWSSLITSGDALTCLSQQGIGTGLNQSTNGAPGVTAVPGVGKFTYNPGIDAQVPTESSALASLLACMSPKLTSDTTITSISDSKITSGQATIQQCAVQGTAIGCAHTANSCHYGGRNCVGSSYAVDLVGDYSALTTIAASCGASTLNEGNHLHVSVGAQNGCGCDASLD